MVQMIKFFFEKYPYIAVFALFLSILIYFIKWIFSHKIENIKNTIKQIEVANLIIKSDLNKPSKKQRFLTEQVFNNIYKWSFSYAEIRALLNSEEPSKAFHAYKKGNKYLKLSTSGKTLVKKKNYKKIMKWGIQITEFFHFILYLITAGGSFLLLALSLYIYKGNHFDSSLYWAICSLAFSIAMFFLAIRILVQSGGIREAEKLLSYYKSD